MHLRLCFWTKHESTHLVSIILVGVVGSRISSGRIERVEGLRFIGLFLEFRDAVNVSVAVLVRRHRCHDMQFRWR